MEFVIVLTMLLFIGFCAFILALAISQTYGKRAGESPTGAATTQTIVNSKEKSL